MAAIASMAALGGLIAASFITVVAHRVPRRESIVGPRSRCPRCGARIAAFDKELQGVAQTGLSVPNPKEDQLQAHCDLCVPRMSPPPLSGLGWRGASQRAPARGQQRDPSRLR
jgi:hypothetical protein